jgi:hypothetical protein
VASPKVRDQLQAIRQVLFETRKRELEWSETGTEGQFTSRVGRDQALLGRDDDGVVVLQFMTEGRPDFTVRLEQLGPDAQATDEELSRDGLLELLLNNVENQVHPHGGENAMSRFTQR